MACLLENPPFFFTIGCLLLLSTAQHLWTSDWNEVSLCKVLVIIVRGACSCFHFSLCLFPSYLVSSAPAVASGKQLFVGWLVTEGWAGGWWQLHSVPPCQNVACSDPPNAQADICKTVCSILWALCPSFYPMPASQLQHLRIRSVRRSLVARGKVFRPDRGMRQLNVTKSKGSYAEILNEMDLDGGK